MHIGQRRFGGLTSGFTMAKQRQTGRSRIGRIVSALGLFVLLLVLIALVTVLVGMKKMHDAYVRVRDNIETVADIRELPQGSQATQVYARDYDPATGGTLLASVFMQNRQQADYGELPPLLLACILSTEDHRFFEHQGVDILGTARAITRGVSQGRDIRGTSTITQQLSRNVFLPYIMTEKTYNRKVQEIILAGAIEKRFSKQQILEAYSNHIFYGAGAYGVRSAARRYFDKGLDELTLAECALLAGLPQAPSKYNPRMNPEAARERRDVVLELLGSRLNTDFFDRLAAADPDKFAKFSLTPADIDEALSEPIDVVSRLDIENLDDSYIAPYFTEYVREYVLDVRYGESQVLRQGYTAVTALDPLYQRWAEEIVKAKVDEYRESRRVSQAALVLLEAATGEVLACVGGYEWHYPTDKGPDETNRALIEDRPVGSAFKPFTYATAYEQGFPVTMTIWDGPNKEQSEKQGRTWPLNADHTYLGWISIFYGLQMSRNAASVDLLVNCTGYEPVIETARKMGITGKLEAVPALTLGVHDRRPIEMAEAFATFANMGVHVESVLVKKVFDQKGVLIEANDGDALSRGNRALSENTAWTMVQNMYRVVEAGTGTRARVRNVKITPDGERTSVQIAGKTGTNDDFADAWFVGYSPELVCAIWVGNDDYGVQMRRMHGGDMPAEVFRELLTRIYDCQYDTIGEGEDAVQMLTYQPRYTKVKFERPAGATFNGFPGPVTGSKLIEDEEGNWISEQQADEEGTADDEASETDGGDGGSDDDFYERWEPPPKHHVYF